MFTKRLFALLSLVMAASLVLTACAGQEVEVTRVVKETVVEKETVIQKETVVEKETIVEKETVIVEGTPEVREVEVTKEVIKEVDSVYGHGEDLSFTSLREMPVTEGFVNETLRLHPPLCTLMRQVVNQPFEYKGNVFLYAQDPRVVTQWSVGKKTKSMSRRSGWRSSASTATTSTSYSFPPSSRAWVASRSSIPAAMVRGASNRAGPMDCSWR